MKGRPRKPQKLHLLAGTYREDRHGGDEPNPLAGVPACPKHLGKDAKRVWKELVRVMEGAGVLTQADVWTMERFCTCIVRRRDAEAQMDAFKMSALLDEGAAMMLKRLYVIIHGETEVLRTLGAALGLSPVARTQLDVTPANQPAGVSVRDRSKGPPKPPAEMA